MRQGRATYIVAHWPFAHNMKLCYNFITRKGGEKGIPLKSFTYRQLKFRGVYMTSEKEIERIEELAEDAEMVLQEDYDKKDLKERRGVMKDSLYDGSKKLKHIIPKGKQV
jgi:hypothetical protein